MCQNIDLVVDNKLDLTKKFLIGNRDILQYGLKVTNCEGIVDATDKFEKISLFIYFEVSYTDINDSSKTYLLKTQTQNINLLVIEKPAFQNCNNDSSFLSNDNVYLGIRYEYMVKF